MELHERPAHEQAIIFMLKSRLSLLLTQIDRQPINSTLGTLARSVVEVQGFLGIEAPKDN